MRKNESQPSIPELRRSTGMSQRKFAEEFGIPRTTLENWEAYDNGYEAKHARCAPAYVRSLLERVIRGEQLGKR